MNIASAQLVITSLKDWIAVITSSAALVLSLVTFFRGQLRERKASDESVVKALQGEKEAVMYVAHKTASPKWQHRLQNETFRNDVITAMCLAWLAESSDRAKAIIFAALTQFVSCNYGKSVHSVLDTLSRNYNAYDAVFKPEDFEKRIAAIDALRNVLRSYEGSIMHMPKRLPITLGSTSAFEVRTYLSETPKYAVAQSARGDIGVTWNPDAAERPNGFPHTYSHQQWFILPAPLARRVLSDATVFDGHSVEKA